MTEIKNDDFCPPTRNFCPMPLSRFKRIAYRIILALFAPIFLLTLLEIGYTLFRLLPNIRPTPQVPMYVWDGNSPEIFFHNNSHPDIDNLGFRSCPPLHGPEEKSPENDFRVLFLGDSVTFGHGVKCLDTFPAIIETINPAGPTGSTKTFNAGVNGYNTFNEFQSYNYRGRNVAPHLVILVTTLNDFANPRLHWADKGNNLVKIPQEAIPNVQYDLDHCIPAFGQLRTEFKMNRFATIKLLTIAKSLFNGSRITRHQDSTWPTYITGEDSLSITQLLSPSSPELMWYSDLIGKLRDSVESDGGKFIVVIIPLSYQLNPQYPHFPQTSIASICSDKKIECIDVLIKFSESRDRKLFLGNENGYNDIWHLSPEGHKILAEYLSAYIVSNIEHYL